MSWMPLQPAVRPKSVSADAIVTISVSKSGRLTQRVFLTVKPRLLPEGRLGWWSYRRRVNVELGTGEHEGRLRLTDQGQFRIMAPTGRKVKDNPASPILQIAGVPGVPADGLGRQTVAWEIAGDALIVTLPWSDAKGMVKPANVAPRAVGAPSAALPVPLLPVLPHPAPPPARLAATPPVPAKMPSDKAAQPLASVAWPYAEIERWAVAHGLGTATHGFDLAKVNALRVERGERPLTIRKSGHGGAS